MNLSFSLYIQMRKLVRYVNAPLNTFLGKPHVIWGCLGQLLKVHCNNYSQSVLIVDVKESANMFSWAYLGSPVFRRVVYRLLRNVWNFFWEFWVLISVFVKIWGQNLSTWFVDYFENYILMLQVWYSILFLF